MNWRKKDVADGSLGDIAAPVHAMSALPPKADIELTSPMSAPCQ